MTWVAADTAIAVPAQGSASDPSVHGAQVIVANTAGSGESARIALPAGGWQRDPTDPAKPLVAWRYRSTGPGSVKARLRGGSFMIRASDKAGTVLPFSLDEPEQGSLAVVLELGGDRACAEFATNLLADAGSIDAACNVRGRFKAGAALAPPACPDTAATPAPRDGCDAWELMDRLVEGQMEAASIPGVGVALVSNGAVVWSKGYGQRSVQPSRPALANTPFMLASISKTFTATAVLQLVQDGVFGLDDDIATILDFPVDNPRVAGNEVITVRHLLAHTSGLADDENVWGGYPGEADSLYVLGDSPIALREFVAGYYVPGGQWYDPARNFTADPPGTGYLYSNVAVALLGQLVEAATGTPLDEWCDAHIFAPLGMNDTGWHLADFATTDVAMPYETTGAGFAAYGQYGYPDYPNGQLRSSAADLGRFLAAYANGGTLDAARILDQSTVDQMLTVQFPAVDPTQGLIWYYDSIGGRTVVGHNGGDYGASTDMFFDPATGDGVVVLVNVDDSGPVVRAMSRIEEALFAIASAP
jgi:CubicO group peptidase (beta-lactamase class C family)